MEADWECSICYQLLLDPVVGKCGHDFCKSCLLSWGQQTRSQAVLCPLCRTEVASTSEQVAKLGVCVRLKRMLENLYPEKVAQRRKERMAEESKSLLAARAAQQQHIRTGRTRFLRARRTRHVPASPSSGILPPSPSVAGPAFHIPEFSFSPPLFTSGPLFPSGMSGGPSTQQPAAGTRSENGMLRFRLEDAHAFNGGQQAGSGAWQAPPAVAFTMGWWEAPNKDARRKRAANRSRMALAAAEAAAQQVQVR